MACCCKPCNTNKSCVSCLGRCDLHKHSCLDREFTKPGPVPKHMGWLYTARDSPEHQLRCGWRPGHISCPVLKKIEQHNCLKSDCCIQDIPCSTQPCSKVYCAPVRCYSITPPPCKQPCVQPSIRITRHGGQYTISTKPSNLSTTPSGPNPLKYVLNMRNDETEPTSKVKYSVEAKFNDYQFDYTSSQESFVVDFSPPDQRCGKPCMRRSIPCIGPSCLL